MRPAIARVQREYEVAHLQPAERLGCYADDLPAVGAEVVMVNGKPAPATEFLVQPARRYVRGTCRHRVGFVGDTRMAATTS